MGKASGELPGPDQGLVTSLAPLDNERYFGAKAYPLWGPQTLAMVSLSSWLWCEDFSLFC